MICAAAGVLLLTAVYSIHSKQIEINVKKSTVDTLKQEGLYPEITHTATSYLDNWTDSIMLGSAAYHSEDSAVRNAMLVRRYASGENPLEALVNWAEKDSFDYVDEYPQYWHGYLVVLKPLLCLTDYAGIRELNAAIQMILTFVTASLLWRRGRKNYIIPYFLSMGMLMPIALAKSLQYSSCWYVFTVAMIALLLIRDEKKQPFVFLFSGIALAFFDFLTYPISTFGIPMVLCLILNLEKHGKSLLKMSVSNLLLWIVGYAGMWGSKLFVGWLFTGTDQLTAAGNHVFHWFDGDRWYSLSYVLYFNIRDFIYTPVTFLCIVFFLYCLFQIRKKRKTGAKLRWNQIWAFVLVAVLPFIWYLFLFNPSGMHHFFTNKACVVTAFSILSMLVSLFDDDVKERRQCQAAQSPVSWFG